MEEYVELGIPCLWIFHCRQEVISEKYMTWTEVEYNTVLQ